MAILPHTVTPAGGNPITLYGETANLNFFLTTPLVPDTAGAVTNKTASVKAHTRRQYPGDPTPINVSATVKEYMEDPGRRSGRGLPGRTIYIIGDVGLPGEEKRAFTLRGDWMDFHAFMTGEAKMQVKIVNKSGAWSMIDGVTP